MPEIACATFLVTTSTAFPLKTTLELQFATFGDASLHPQLEDASATEALAAEQLVMTFQDVAIDCLYM